MSKAFETQNLPQKSLKNWSEGHISGFHNTLENGGNKYQKAKDSKQFPDGHKRKICLFSNAESCPSTSFLLTSKEIPTPIIDQILMHS